MGRPRKRRRDDTGASADVYSETSRTSNPSSNETPSFSNFSLINPVSQSDFPEFSGFVDFQNNDSMLNPLGTQQHVDSSQTNGHSHGHAQNLE
jgi:hypothetical protein